MRKREAFSSAAREERSDEAKAGGEAARGHPSSPTIELETVLERGPFLFGPAHGIRTRQGAELRKREAFSSAAREGRRPEAKAGGVSRTRHPSSPTTELLGLQRWRPFFFSGPSQRDSNPTGCGAEETRSVFQRSTRGAERRSGARAAKWTLGEYPCAKNAKYEYCD